MATYGWDGGTTAVRKQPRRTLPIVLAVAALLALAVAGFTLWNRSGTKDDGASPATVTATIDVGGSPGPGTFGAGSLWFTHTQRPDAGAAFSQDALERTPGNRLVRVDAASRRPQATIDIPIPSTLVFGSGAVWVVSQHGGSVSRIDPATNKIVATIRVGGFPLGAVATSDSVWVTSSTDGAVHRIDPRSNKVVATISGLASPTGIVAHDGRLWVANGGDAGYSVVGIDPTTNKIAESFKMPLSPDLIVAERGSLWVGSSFRRQLLRIDPGSGKVLATIELDGRSQVLTVHRGRIWVGLDTTTIDIVDPASEQVTRRVSLPARPRALTEADGDLWASPVADDAEVLRIAS